MKRVVITWNDVLREIAAMPHRSEVGDNMPNRIDPTSSFYVAGDALKAVLDQVPEYLRLAGTFQMPGGASALIFEDPDETP